MSRTFKLSVLAAGLLAAAPFAQAFEAGDLLLRVGAVHVAPDDSSDPLTVKGFGPLAGNKDRLAGTEVGVDSDTQLGIRGTYMFTNHLGVGVLGATPFNHHIEGEKGLSGFGTLGKTKHLPPTVTLQYYPLDSASKVQPYAGIGVNYTTFFEEDTNATLTGVVDATANALYGTPLGTVDGTDMELDDSFGLALELGVDYMITDNLGVNAAMWWADINTDATISAYAGDTKVAEVTTEVEIDPMVYMVGVTYKF